jgi:hypothetical protein
VHGGRIAVRCEVVEVLAGHADHVAGSVLLEVVDQLLLVRRAGLDGLGHQGHQPDQRGEGPPAHLLRGPHDGAEEPGLVLGREAYPEQHDGAAEVAGQHHVERDRGAE